MNKEILRKLINWTIPSCGVGVTIYLIVKQKWGLAIIASGITLAIAIYLFIRWWKFTSEFQRQYYHSLVSRYCPYRTQGLNTQGAFTPDLDKVFVCLSVLPKSPEQISGSIIQKPVSAENLTIWDFIAATRRKPVYRRIILMGAPGSGKTKQLEYLTLTYAQNQEITQHPKAPKLIPIVLYLREISQVISRDKPPSLPLLVTQILKSREWGLTLDPPLQWFQEKLHLGKCLVMLDGLDEIKDEREQKNVSHWLNNQMLAYPETTFIVTSRPSGDGQTKLKEARIYLELEPFHLKQIEEFLKCWYMENEILRQARKETAPWVEEVAKKKANSLMKSIRNFPSLTAMAFNPLLLIIMVTFHENRAQLPKNRAQLYGEIFEVLLARRQNAKGIPDLLPFQPGQKQFLLQLLALELMRRQTTEFTLAVAKQIIEKPLATVAAQKVSTQEFLKHIENLSGLIVETERRVYQFSHIGFQEYLAAVQIKEMNQEQFLIKKIEDTWWGETIRLYAAMTDTTNLILSAWKANTVTTMTLAYDFLEEGKNVPRDLKKKLEQWLEEALESSDPEIATLAAQVHLSRRLKYAVAGD